MEAQRAVECALFRGGTSKGVFIEAGRIPKDRKERNDLLLHLLGGDSSQLDGLGGGNVLSSKVALVEASPEPGVDIDYHFIQVMPARGVDDTVPCGNIISAVAPFAVEAGIVEADDPVSRLSIRDTNTGAVVSAEIPTPGGRVAYDGDEEIAGVQRPGAPIALEYSNVSGLRTGSLWPTGSRIDSVNGVQVSLVDGAIPVAVFPAECVGLPDDAKMRTLSTRDMIDILLELREEVAAKGGIDTAGTSVPKVCLVMGKPAEGADLAVRYFTPHTPHSSLAVTGAITVASAALIEGTVANGRSRDGRTAKPGEWVPYRIEHVAGVLPLEVMFAEDSGGLVPAKARLVRTARLLMRGTAYLPKY